MALPQSQSYAQTYNYQPTFSNYTPQNNHYPTANFGTVPPNAPYVFTNPQYSGAKQEVVAAPSLSTPESSPEVTPEIASKALQKLISAGLKEQGFDGGEPAALERLEAEIVAFVSEIYQRAHEYGNLANRTNPAAKDVLKAVEDLGFKHDDFKPSKFSSKKRKRVEHVDELISLTASPSAHKSPPKLLDSDDEDTTSQIPSTLRALPHFYPALPPKHTYLRTPPSPPRKQALPSLEKKLKTASLVQESLRNLLVATEDVVGPDDGELLGAIVNWEASTHPRKRWKVHAPGSTFA
ncbi:hypothetical protein OF83DRAFT_1059435 [Amylostereum chailletii]|nr:hypothetical protein OF83DRAFT_1059435 [Amylostereum chailletii]